MPPQHMEALDRANEVRLARAELKRQVADGEVSVSEIIMDCPTAVETMAIGQILIAQHRWGQKRVLAFLGAVRIAETKKIGTLTLRQRLVINARLHEGTDIDGALNGLLPGDAA